MINKDLRKGLYGYFTTKLGMKDYRRGWLKGDCPFCGKEKKFGINLFTDRGHCFYCEIHIKPVQVVLDLEKIQFPKLVNLLSNLDSSSFNNYESKLKYTPDKEYEKLQLPEGFKLLIFGESQIAKLARNYIKNKRHLNVEKLALKGWGYCTKGTHMGHIIMPVYNMDKELIYYVTRAFINTGIKFLNPDTEKFGIGKSSIIYNFEALYKYSSIDLVESIINAETLGDKAIATLGKSLSKYQVQQIIISPVKSVNVILDPDALKQSIELVMELSNYKKVRLINLPEGEDVNSYGKTKTNLLKEKTEFQTYRDLINLKCKLQWEENRVFI